MSAWGAFWLIAMTGALLQARLGVSVRLSGTTDPDRLVVHGRFLIGRLLFAIPLLLIPAYALEAWRHEKADLASVVVACILFVPASSALLFARGTTAIDRKAGRVLRSWGTPFLARSLPAVVGPFRTVRIESQRSDKKHHVTLVHDGGAVPIGEAGSWEAATELAETVAKFLRVGVDDRVVGETHLYEELDLPFGARPARALPSEAAMGPRTLPLRARVSAAADGALRIGFPRPGRQAAMPWAILAAVVGVVWAVPALLLARFAGDEAEFHIWFVSVDPWLAAILPTALYLACALKAGLGYGAEVEATASRLVVRSRGLVLQRRFEIPARELEALHVEASSFLVKGNIVAHSDDATVRFGHGLSLRELHGLVERLEQVLDASADRPMSSPRASPVPRSWSPLWWPFGVFALAAVIALPMLANAPPIRRGDDATELFMVGLPFILSVAGGIGISLVTRLLSVLRGESSTPGVG